MPTNSQKRKLIRQVLDDAPQPPRQLVRDIPPELERICLKAVAKDQQDCYSTAVNFAEDLRRVLPAAVGSSDSARMVETATSEARPTSSRCEAVPVGDAAGMRMRSH